MPNLIVELENISQICSGITRGGVLNGELKYALRLQKLIYLHLPTDCFMKISVQLCRLERNLHETVCRQMQMN